MVKGESIVNREKRIHDERIEKFNELVKKENELKAELEYAETHFKNIRLGKGRITRERLALQKEIIQKKNRAKQIDYRIRRWNRDNPGKAFDLLVELKS
jgi:hypothetical protein